MYKRIQRVEDRGRKKPTEAMAATKGRSWCQEEELKNYVNKAKLKSSNSRQKNLCTISLKYLFSYMKPHLEKSLPQNTILLPMSWREPISSSGPSSSCQPMLVCSLKGKI